MDLDGATILLTGGTGSFGRAFTSLVVKNWPGATIRVFSRDELKQSEMAAEFPSKSQLRFFIGDVRDRGRVARAMRGADIVVHAAALKQVPACEYNPFEAVQTNIIGAQNVIDAAIDSEVKRVVGLSTDKAVNPLNLYGATKLCAEKLFVQGNAYAADTGSRLSCVRYGNVLASRGSVVPALINQMEQGRLKITDPRMTRFWISLTHAVELVLFALEHATGGEIFVPKIPSMRLVDLAEAVAPGLPIDIVGIRPGEKLHEVLITDEESRRTVDVGDHYAILPEHPWWNSASVWSDRAFLAEGFVYSSETNDRWLGIDEMRRILDVG